MLLALIGCSKHDNAAVTKYELSANEKIDKKEMSVAVENAQAKLGLKKITMKEMRKSIKVEKAVE